jgi:hypothetical protein
MKTEIMWGEGEVDEVCTALALRGELENAEHII